MSKGFIYILVNPVMKGIVKIGKTKRTSEERANELSRSTGIPIKFEICADFLVEDCDLMETIIHRKLNEFRINNRKEFFRLELKDAIKRVEEIIHVEEINSLYNWWKELSLDWKKILKLEVADFGYEESTVFNLNKHEIEKVNANMLERIVKMTFFGKYQHENLIQDIKPLNRLKKLQTVDLFRSSIKSLSPLKETYSLRKIDITDTLIESLSPLSNLEDLTDLCFTGTKVKDLEPIKKNKKLKVIDMCNTEISSLNPLKDMDNLERIFFNRTKVNNLSPLMGISNLTIVSAVECENISNDQILDFRSKRSDCVLITNLEELRKWNE